MTLALAVLAASLVGSPHCAGMCGGFVCFYAGAGSAGGVQGGREGSGRAVAHLAYNGGRLASYLLLGVLAGTLGAGLNAAGRLAGVSRVAAVAAGALMVGWGLSRLAVLHGVRLGGVDGAIGTGALRLRLAALLRRAREWPAVARAGATGLLTTLLPCGWLYAFVVTAAGAGSAAGGALVMLAFWAGTLPMMVAVGMGVQRLAGPFARRLPAASAVLLVVLGLGTIAGRLRTDVAFPSMSAETAPAVPSTSAHGSHGTR